MVPIFARGQQTLCRVRPGVRVPCAETFWRAHPCSLPRPLLSPSTSENCTYFLHLRGKLRRVVRGRVVELLEESLDALPKLRLVCFFGVLLVSHEQRVQRHRGLFGGTLSLDRDRLAILSDCPHQPDGEGSVVSSGIQLLSKLSGNRCSPIGGGADLLRTPI